MRQITNYSNCAALLQITRKAWDDSKTNSSHIWTKENLQEFIRCEFKETEIFLLSQREPYEHHLRDNNVQLETPVGGLVSALEPVMSACAGTWIAHGSGSADWQVVSDSQHIQVPPNKPSYTLRRIKLSEQEMRGHYLGLCNQALWPLCNQAYVRPIFRNKDWECYKKVNQRFCQAVIQEARTTNPLVLVQDYHLALVPQMLRRLMPKATIVTFWHIPWPHPKTFSIFPWREQLLEGLLGSDVLGFQTNEHKGYFSNAAKLADDTVNERIHVDDYPISIAWPCPDECVIEDIAVCRQKVRSVHGLNSNIFLGLGIDRLDYVKGIVEQFLSIQRLLEIEPQWIGKFSFIQILAPSRLIVPEYRAYQFQIKSLADLINNRFGNKNYQPIVLVLQSKNQKQVYQYYRACDFCFISSLDDGMNLVAKEFVAARDDLCGVLLLSQFAGSSAELSQALCVNPYNVDECARTMSRALRMPRSQQVLRMQAMRDHVKEHNVFRWAGNLLSDALLTRRKSSGDFKNVKK